MAHPKMTGSQTKAMKQAINAKQAPRRCEKVEYAALVKVDGIAIPNLITSKTEESDKWLNKLFDNKK